MIEFLLDAGYRVAAVEPNDASLDAITAALATGGQVVFDYDTPVYFGRLRSIRHRTSSSMAP